MTDSSRSSWAPVHLEASFSGPTDDVPTPGECLELSRDQLFIGTPDPAAEGQVVRFEIGSDADLGTIRGAARVMWTSEGEGAEAPRGMALRVVRLDPGCVQMLEMYLATAPLADTGTRPLVKRSDVPPAEGSGAPAASGDAAGGATAKSASARAQRSLVPGMAPRTGAGVYSMRPEPEDTSGGGRSGAPDPAATRRLRARLSAMKAGESSRPAPSSPSSDAAAAAELQSSATLSIPRAPALPVELRAPSTSPGDVGTDSLDAVVLPAVEPASVPPVDALLPGRRSPTPTALAVALGHIDGTTPRRASPLPGRRNPTPTALAAVLGERSAPPPAEPSPAEPPPAEPLPAAPPPAKPAPILLPGSRNPTPTALARALGNDGGPLAGAGAPDVPPTGQSRPDWMPVRPNVDGLLAQLGGTGAGAGGRGAAHGAAGASGGASQAAGAPRPTALARALSASGAPPEPVDTAAQSALARALRRTAELQSGEADTGPAAEPPAPQREFTLTGDVPAARLRLKPWLRRIGFVVLTGVLTVGGYLWVNAPPSAPHAPSPAPAQPATAAAPAPVAALAPAEPAPAPSVAPAPVSPTAAHYFVELITTPAGAQVVLGTQVVITPGVLDLGTLDEPTKLVAELAGHRAAQTVINRLGFEFDEGRWSRKVYLNLRPDPTAPPPAPLPTPGVVATTAAQPAPAVPTAPAPTPATAPAVAARPAAAAATSGQRASVAAPSPPVSVPPEQGVVITRVGRSAPATPPAAPAPAPGSEPSAAPAKKGPRTVAVPGTPAAAATDAGRLDKAMACLSQGDNACVISTLEGKARSPREFQLLIETYRSTGQQDAARANAERFLKLQPDAKEARRYAKLFGLALPE